MDFDLSEEQDMLRKFGRDFMTDNCPSEYVRAKAAEVTFGDADFHRDTVAVAMGL